MSLTDNLSYGEFMAILIGAILLVAFVIIIILYYRHTMRGYHGVD